MEYNELKQQVAAYNAKLIAVSKTKPDEAILNLYQKGQRIFGENRVQELCGKFERLPKDIEWHMIGHLQSKKVKQIAPFVHTIHSLDRVSIIEEVEKQLARQERNAFGLLQLKIGAEVTKGGFASSDLIEWLKQGGLASCQHLKIRGVMGMATFTNDMKQVKSEFVELKNHFDQLKNDFFLENDDFSEISMGMSGDYTIALENGSTMVRIGSLLFGSRA